MKKPPPLTKEQTEQILGDEKPLAIAILGQHPPRELISLWDMFRVFLPDVLPRWVEIEKAASEYKAAAYDPSRKHQSSASDDRKYLCKIASDLQFICSQLELEHTAYQATQFLQTIAHQGTDRVSINILLQNLISTVQMEMSEKIFTRIPTIKANYFENDVLFGPNVETSFPEAADDIKAAGNCLAADLNTAAVFHLMCIANFGLIRIARQLRVIIKKTPLEFAEWQKMIEKSEKKLKQKSIGAGKGKKEQEDIRTFCNKMLVKINEFKDIRNSVCHARGSYTAARALSVFEDVKKFMNELAARWP